MAFTKAAAWHYFPPLCCCCSSSSSTVHLPWEILCTQQEARHGPDMPFVFIRGLRHSVWLFPPDRLECWVYIYSTPPELEEDRTWSMTSWRMSNTSATSSPRVNGQYIKQLSRDGSLHGSGISHATTASPKPSLRATWRIGDAVISRGKFNAGWTTSKSGRHCPCQNCWRWPPPEKDWKRMCSTESSFMPLLPPPPTSPTTQSVMGLK